MIKAKTYNFDTKRRYLDDVKEKKQKEKDERNDKKGKTSKRRRKVSGFLQENE